MGASFREVCYGTAGFSMISPFTAPLRLDFCDGLFRRTDTLTETRRTVAMLPRKVM